MILRLYKSESIKNIFFRETKMVFLSMENIKKIESHEETANIYQIGSYTEKLTNVLDVKKLRNINRTIKFRKGNTRYYIVPHPDKKETVNVVIQELDPENRNKTKKLSVFSFKNGRLIVERDVFGEITSGELLKFFRDFNIQLREIDLIVKKEYEFYLIKQRLPGIFCTDWKKPFNKKLHAKGDDLEIKNTTEKIELSYITKKGQKLSWKLNKDYLLINGDLDKLLYVLNRFSNELVGFDKEIGMEIKNEKDEARGRINNLEILFTPDNNNSRVRNFAKEYKKTENNKLFISGSGDKIIFIYKNSGHEQKWEFDADKNVRQGSPSLRDLSYVLKSFYRESEDLKKYLKEKEEEKKKTDGEIISFIGKYPKLFLKRNTSVNLKGKDGEILKISAADAFNPDGSKFFLTFEKNGTAKHFYFNEKSLQSQTDDVSPLGPPFGAEKQGALPGESKKTYYFNTEAGQMLSILKRFEPQISKSLT